MIYIGIDPGLTGALATNDYGVCTVVDLPAVEVGQGVVRRQLDVHLLAQMFRSLHYSCYQTDDEGCFAVLERTSSMPGQGVASMFSMGMTRGILQMGLAAAKIPFVEVVPTVWKRHYDLLGKDKDASLALAREKFLHVRKHLALTKHHNRAEALLLADYGTTKGLGK